MLYYPFEVLISGLTKDYSGHINGTISGVTEVKRGILQEYNNSGERRRDFTKIQDAIDWINYNESPSSSNIWTVLVYPGEYVETTVDAKSYINIIGVDNNSCIINGSLRIKNGISNIIVENLTITNNIVEIFSDTATNMSDIVLKHLNMNGGLQIQTVSGAIITCVVESCVIKRTNNYAVNILGPY